MPRNLVLFDLEWNLSLIHIWVLVLELHSCLHGVAHFQHIVDGSSGIVGVAGPVDLAGLGHQEEALLVVQQFNALFDIDVYKRQLLICTMRLASFTSSTRIWFM